MKQGYPRGYYWRGTRGTQEYSRGAKAMRLCARVCVRPCVCFCVRACVCARAVVCVLLTGTIGVLLGTLGWY